MPHTRRLIGSHGSRNLITVLAHHGPNVQIQTASGNRATVSASWLHAYTKPVA